MSYKVTISDSVLQESIESVSFEIDPPPDDIDDMYTYSKNSIKIKGKIGVEEDITVLSNWAVIRATEPECYKELVVEEFRAGQLIRKITFSKAFVISYSERYTDHTGIGHFQLFVRQKATVDIECTNEEGNNVDDSTNIEHEKVDILEKNVTQKGHLASVRNRISGVGEKAKKYSTLWNENQAYQSISTFREDRGLEVLEPNYEFQKSDGKNTVAFTQEYDSKYFGVNSTIRTDDEKELAKKYFNLLVENGYLKDEIYPRGKAQFLTHAEAFTLMKAYEENGGSIGKNVTVFVDRPTCSFCQNNLPKLQAAMGIDVLTVVNENGDIYECDFTKYESNSKENIKREKMKKIASKK